MSLFFIPLLPPVPPSLHNSATLCTMYHLHEWTYYGECIQMLLTKTVTQHKTAVNHYARPSRLLTYAGGGSVIRVNNSIVRSRQNSKLSLCQEAPHYYRSFFSHPSFRFATVPHRWTWRTETETSPTNQQQGCVLRPARKQRCPKRKILSTYSSTLRSAVSIMQTRIRPQTRYCIQQRRKLKKTNQA
jgi:hypothetical protein